jgi:hypothetical protein
MSDETYEQRVARISGEQFEERVERLAQDLEKLAGKVRQTASRNQLDRATYIQHAVLWGFANLNIDNLPRYGREADFGQELAERAAKGAPDA